MDIKYPVPCPLIGRKIDMNVCFDIHMVVEQCAPKHTAPEEIIAIPNYADICKNCKYHRND